MLKVTFVVLNLCNAHNSGNIACFDYSVKGARAACVCFPQNLLSKSKAVTYTGKVLISQNRKPCYRDIL